MVKQRKLTQRVLDRLSEDSPKKIPKTLYLTEDNVKALQKTLKRLPGKPTMSHVVDTLIEEFLADLEK